jgi:hypothetical protein
MAVLLLIIAFSVDFRAPAPVRRSCGRQANADWANPWSMVKRDPIQVSLLRLFSITFHAFEKISTRAVLRRSTPDRRRM